MRSRRVVLFAVATIAAVVRADEYDDGSPIKTITSTNDLMFNIERKNKTVTHVPPVEIDVLLFSDDFSLVTCGSTLKLKHKTGFHLHSHDINWGSGSGQQSVTAMKSSDDTNSLWTVASPHGQPICPQGTPIKCGSTVRLIHHNTKKFLHSHRHASPVSHRFEISGYGNSNENHSDTGDNWKVECESHSGYWQRDSKVKFLHPDTGGCLHAQKDISFTNQNCRGCPIIGQLEVCGLQNCQYVKSADSFWKAADGIFFSKREI